jgi:hypothetical protein
MEPDVKPIIEETAKPATPATLAKPVAPAITVDIAKAAPVAATASPASDSGDDEDDDVEEDNEVVKALERQVEKLKRKIAGKTEKRSARKTTVRKQPGPEVERRWFRPLIG